MRSSVEQALLGELAPQPLEPLEQVAEADVPQLEDLHREGAALEPVVRLDQRDDAVALLELLGELRAASTTRP